MNCSSTHPRIPAIPTWYHGVQFRSRLEARWAVFFDALHLQWHYEYEGYDLGPLGWYLPDFWLPQWRVFIEIKPDDPSPDERAKCLALADGVPATVALFTGLPNSDGGDIWCAYEQRCTAGLFSAMASVYWVSLPGIAIALMDLGDRDPDDRLFFHRDGESAFPQMLNMSSYVTPHDLEYVGDVYDAMACAQQFQFHMQASQ